MATLGLALALLGGLLTPAFAAPADPPVLSMTSSVSPTQLIVGAAATYTVTVQNTGNVAAANVTTILPFQPAGTLTIGSPLPAACTSSAQTVTCTEATIPANGSVTYTIPVTLLSNGSNGENIALHGVATATGVQAATTNLITVAFDQADVAITKTAAATVGPGGTITYTLTVTNNGPSDAQGVAWDDQTNGNLTTITAYPCGNTGLTVTCYLGTLAAGATRTFTVPETVNASVAPGTAIPNCVVVYTGTPDPNSANNQSCVNTTVSGAPPAPTSNIQIVKSAPATVQQGGTIPYSVTITNTGPDPATNVAISGPLGAALASAGALPPACTLQGTAVDCQIATLAVGESRTYTYSATLAPSATAGTNIVNCTSVISENQVTAPGNLQACAQTLVVPVPTADLAIVKQGPAKARPGDTLSYTLAVTNSGPDDAANVVVTDPTDPALVTVTAVPAGCQVTAGTVSCALGTLAAGATSTPVTVTVQVNPAVAPGTVIHNCGSVTSSTADPNIPDATSCADTYIDPPVPVAQLALAKSGPPTAYAGDTVSYTLSATNLGPDAATDVILTDALDSQLTVASLPSGCTASAGTVTCTAGILAVGATAAFSVTATVAAGVAAGTAIQNCASASSVSTVLAPAPQPGCVQTVIAPPPADIAISATGPATAAPGSTLSYTLIAINNGPGAAPNATVTVPVDLTLVTITSLPPGCADTGGRLICLAGTLAAGGSQAFPVTVRLNPGVQGVALPNCAQATTTAQDPNLSNNQLCGAITVGLPSPQRAVAEVVKRGPVAVSPGGTISYSVTVTNRGPDAVSDLSVTDPMATPLASVSLPGNCVLNAGVVTCVAGPLAAGQSKTFSYAVRVAAGTTPGTLITNCAGAASVIAVITLEATAGCTETVVLPAAQDRLDVAKTGPRTTHPGAVLDYPVTVTNYGTSAASNVLVKDPILDMARVTVVSLPSGCALAGDTVTCALGTLPAGAARRLIVRLRAGAATGNGRVLSNCADAYSPTDTLNINHAQACATTIVRTPFLPVTG